MMRERFLALALGLAVFMLTGLSPQPLGAQEEAEIGLEQQDPVLDSGVKVKPRDPTKGSVTNMPIPRYVSLKGGEGNARRGPGLTHRIDWVFTTAGMPLRGTAEHEHWRRVEDAEGMGGWVHYALLSGVRTVLVTQDMAEFHDRADLASPVAFQTEMGVIGRLIECNPDWCRVNIQGEKGWAQKTALWGVDAGEVIE